MYQTSRPPLSVSVSGLLFRESHYSCTALLFFLMPRLFMRCIHPCFTSIHASHLITRRTRLCVSCATHKLLICLTDTCIHAFILSLLQVMYQLHGIAPSLRFCFSPHVSATRHYVPCPICSPIYVSHIWPHTP